MTTPRRIDPMDARLANVSGIHEAMLVCAYDDEEKCRRHLLEGAISLSEFERELPSIPWEREIIFYCA